MAKDFILLFEGCEGSSAFMQLLSDTGRVYLPAYEPLDAYRFTERGFGTDMSEDDLLLSLELLYRRGDTKEREEVLVHLRERYTSEKWEYHLDATAEHSVGIKFRMRYGRAELFAAHFADNEIAPVIITREDKLRQAISHLATNVQFQLMNGTHPDDLPPVTIDTDALASCLKDAQAKNAKREAMKETFKARGIDFIEVTYEDFVLRKRDLLSRTLSFLGHTFSGDTLDRALNTPEHYRKGYPVEFSKFITNHGEVLSVAKDFDFYREDHAK